MLLPPLIVRALADGRANVLPTVLNGTADPNIAESKVSPGLVASPNPGRKAIVGFAFPVKHRWSLPIPPAVIKASSATAWA